jgi:CheY-like chemotaxis protein
VAQLLAFSRKQMLKLHSFSPNEVVSQTRDMLEHIIGEDVELKTVLNPRAGLVRADFHQMEQVLMNLVGNAREAMPTGGKITIETDNVILDQDYADSHTDALPGPHVMLAVSDNGTGMDQATQKRVFEPFFTTKETGKGTGLGLAMVYGIVKQLGGNIYLYSEPGQGSTFKVYLPRDESQEPMEESPTPAEELSTGNETILMVEDDSVVRELICTALDRLGYQVIEANDSDDALRLMASQGPEVDLLITDVIMPGMSGRELAERILAQRPELKVLYISGYTANVIVHHGVLDQGISFLQKPVSLADLAKKVREVLEN